MLLEKTDDEKETTKHLIKAIGASFQGDLYVEIQ